MPTRKDEAVTSGPFWVAWIMSQVPSPDRVCHGSGAHGQTGMARIGFFHHGGCQDADVVGGGIDGHLQRPSRGAKREAVAVREFDAVAAGHVDVGNHQIKALRAQQFEGFFAPGGFNNLVPINRKHPIAELLEACWHYIDERNGRSVTFEYVMLEAAAEILRLRIEVQLCRRILPKHIERVIYEGEG